MYSLENQAGTLLSKTWKISDSKKPLELWKENHQTKLRNDNVSTMCTKFNSVTHELFLQIVQWFLTRGAQPNQF